MHARAIHLCYPWNEFLFHFIRAERLMLSSSCAFLTLMPTHVFGRPLDQRRWLCGHLYFGTILFIVSINVHTSTPNIQLVICISFSPSLDLYFVHSNHLSDGCSQTNIFLSFNLLLSFASVVTVLAHNTRIKINKQKQIPSNMLFVCAIVFAQIPFQCLYESTYTEYLH